MGIIQRGELWAEGRPGVQMQKDQAVACEVHSGHGNVRTLRPEGRTCCEFRWETEFGSGRVQLPPTRTRAQVHNVGHEHAQLAGRRIHNADTLLPATKTQVPNQFLLSVALSFLNSAWCRLMSESVLGRVMWAVSSPTAKGFRSPGDILTKVVASQGGQGS